MVIKTDLTAEHIGSRWRDKDGDTWHWTGNSWTCDGKILAAYIWATVPADFGPFTEQ